VEVLAERNGKPVLVQQGRVMAATFHPELTDDTKIHERFVKLASETGGAKKLENRNSKNETRRTKSEEPEEKSANRKVKIGR
ncbi:MAG TPA: hypothetical protein VGU63_03675, partial [Candidatus Acidoferrales bacterium]|nr:hypothetical protein [Candidatus Acidoferrales bacterium]